MSPKVGHRNVERPLICNHLLNMEAPVCAQPSTDYEPPLQRTTTRVIRRRADRPPKGALDRTHQNQVDLASVLIQEEPTRL